jgi:membrane associated rhomboid family serine protease
MMNSGERALNEREMPSNSAMNPEKMRIPAHSRRQAMDWSLVLVSQGIETVIAQNDTTWELLVPVGEYEQAIAALRQYRHENRHWTWQRQVFKGGLVFDWASLSWVILLLFFNALDAPYDLETRGILSNAAVAHGEWWRVFTAIWLHADWSHLASNAAIGLVLLGLTMGRFGTGTGLLGAYVAGALANAAECLLADGARRSLGASGMVMGSLGILATQSFFLWRTPYGRKYVLTSVGAGLMLFILFGLAPGTNIIAHFGGFLGGLILGGLLSFSRRITHKPALNFLCGLIFVVLIIVPWWKALRTAV